jgi:alkylhydroperoxidase family enzyme
MTDDEIAALDGDWEKIPPADRAAYRFTLKLTREPHRVGAEDIRDLRKFFTANQVAEIVQAVAGYNSTNRWTDALNIPAEENGDFFRRGTSAKTKVELDTFLTPTSDAYIRQVTRIAPMKAEEAKREPLEPFADLASHWQKASTREPILPLAGEATDPVWVRLLKVFPVANKGRISTLLAAETKGKLDTRTKLLVAWTCARHDRAWYMQSQVARRMAAAGINSAELLVLDSGEAGVSDKDRAVIGLARKMTVAPWTVTDADVAAVRQHYSPFQVAEIVLHACNAAYLDRLTETAQLPVEKAPRSSQ